jgi:hypothetical protein
MPNPIQRRLLFGGKTPWYLSGGIALSDVAGVWKPKGSSSLAMSYLRIAGNSGNANIDPAVVGGVAPTWDAVSGWIGSTSVYLKTGIIPAAGWSVIVQYSNAPTGTKYLFGEQKVYDTDSCMISPSVGAGTGIRYAAGTSVNVSPHSLAGILAIANTQGYRNGIIDGGATSGISGSPIEFYIFALNNNGVSTGNCSANISVIAFYRINIAPYVAALVAAIQAV